MAASERPIIETRHDQMFPVLEPAEIDRVRRFGETRFYRAGERLTTTGEVGPGMFCHPGRQRRRHPARRAGEWLSQYGVALDDNGFVLTDASLVSRPLETNRPGVFAIGDVRSGSVKRVAAAVGEGAQVVATLHAFLAEAGDKPAFNANPARV